MCGINLSFSDLYPAKEMNKLIRHRGLPGMEKSWDYQGFSMGHVRLPILGLSDKFDQPFETDGWVFAFNGEVFNYQSLMPGAQSDVELFEAFFSKYGGDPDSKSFWEQLQNFDGFWSLIAYSKKKHKVYVVTDFLAKKPLYMHKYSHHVSSELKAFCGVPKTLNDRYFAAVNKWGYSPTDMTPWNEILKIPRGMVMTLDAENGQILNNFRYYELNPRPNNNLRICVEDAIKNRLVSDVPISLLLSGGVDSSIIYKVMEKHTHNFEIFHIANNEAKFLDCLDIPGDIKVTSLDLKSNYDLDDILYANDGPVDLGSMLPQYRMAEAIAETGYKVCITGDGADEVFGGYNRQYEYDAQHSDIFDELVCYHLPRLDKMSMYFTTELRSPFLAASVVECGLGMDYRLRVNKNGLKTAFADIIPKEILDRKKHALKSKKVLSGVDWRYELVDRFIKNVMPKYT